MIISKAILTILSTLSLNPSLINNHSPHRYEKLEPDQGTHVVKKRMLKKFVCHYGLQDFVQKTNFIKDISNKRLTQQDITDLFNQKIESYIASATNPAVKTTIYLKKEDYLLALLKM